MITHRAFVASLILSFSLLTACTGLPESAPAPSLERLQDVDRDPAAGVAALQGTDAGLLAGTAAAPTPQVASGSTGFFGLFGGAGPDAGDSDTVPPLSDLPLGEIGVTCGLSPRDLGTKVAAVSGYTLYDTFAKSTAPRPHYVTGFRDGCARQFTAALVLTGDVGTHEVVRYQTAQASRTYTRVDNAYEAIKARVCRAAHGTPCGRALDRLSRRTTFLTAYPRFTSSDRWVEILLHDGTIAAVGIEGA